VAVFRQAQRVIPRVLWGGIALYGIGQVVAWWLLIRTTEAEDPFHRPTTAHPITEAAAADRQVVRRLC
jgi:hypothetical protein